MGKRIIPQRRGKGSPAYRVPDHRYKIERVGYLSDFTKGQVTGLYHDLRTYPVAEITTEDGRKMYVPAAEGLMVGEWIENEGIKVGNVLPLEKIPEGTPVFNIEGTPGDGGKFVRSGGTYAIVMTKTEGAVYVKLPSKKIREFNPRCRATIGAVAGGGRKEKPLIKAGKAYYKMRARNKLWPKVRGVHMNAVNHPHGGKEHHPPGATTVSRRAPPGRKVGHIAARRTGRRKK